MGLFESTKINFILLSDLDLCMHRTEYARESRARFYRWTCEFEFGRISWNRVQM